MPRSLVVAIAAGVLVCAPLACEKKPPPRKPARQTQPHATPAPVEETPTTPPPPPPPPSFDSLGDAAAAIRALRAGGYVLAIRHTKTTQGVLDEQGTNYEDCTKQRNLNDEGREQARQLGAVLTDAKVPVGEVLSSPFCRNKETAQLMFGKAATLDAAIIGDNPDAVTKLKALLGTSPAEGKNTVIISHQKAMTACTGHELFTYNEGAVLVMKPLGDGKSEVVTIIQPEHWPALVEAGKSAP